MDYKAEVERLRKENDFLKSQTELINNSVTAGIYNLGPEFFNKIVEHLNTALHADYTFIGKLTGDNSIETISLYGGGKLIENITYELRHTPCENVIGKTICTYPQKVTELFPNDIPLQEMEIEGYMGVPLFNSKKEANGILVVLYKKPIPNPKLAETTLLIMALKAGAELEHEEVYRQLNHTQELLKGKNDELNIQNRELNYSEKKYKQLTENLPDIIMVIDKQYRITYANRTLTGENPYTVIGRSVLMLDPDEKNRINAKEHADNVFSTGRQLEYERKLQLGEETYYLRVKLIPQTIDKTVNSIIYIIEDLTNETKLKIEKEKSEKALKKSQERFSLAMKASQDGLFDWDLVSGQIYYSPGWKSMIGYEDDELENTITVFEKLTHPEDFKSNWIKHNTLINKETDRFESEIRMRHKKGHWVHILAKGQALFDEKGEAIRIIGTHMDITKRKRMESALKKSENRFKDFANSVTDIYFAMDKELNYIFWNKACEEALGFKSEQVLGKSYYEFNKGYEWIAEKYKHIIKTGVAESFEVTYAPATNVKIYFIVNAYPSKNGIVVYLKDITERKLAEIALTKNQKQLELIFNNSPAIMMLLNKKTEIITVNNTGLNFANKTIEQVRNKMGGYLFNCVQALASEDGCGHSEKCENCIVRNTVLDTITNSTTNNKVEAELLVEMDGVQEKLYVLVSSAVATMEPEPTYLITIDDITERKRAEIALEESENRIKQLADLAFEGIVIHKNCIGENVNRSFLKMTGYIEKDIIGKDVINLLIPKKHIPIIKKRIKNNITDTIEIEITRKDGTTFLAEIVVKIISKRQHRRMISIRDITEQKQTEQKILNAIIQTEENERKRIAQELHDGLGPVLSTVKLYSQTYINSANEEFKEKIKQQLLSGIDDALEQVSTISNNLSPHVLNDFGLKIAIQKFIEKIKEISNIEITFQFDYENAIKKDVEITLYRVAIELINNTIKHAHALKIQIDIFGEKSNIKLYYQDDGIGFEIDEMKDKRKGMGLFNITSRIKSLGGEVTFIRGEDKGISYRMSIPN